MIVDNTVATPILLRPIEHNADVVHSLTKFMGGHGIVDSGPFNWRAHADRYRMFSEPDESYHGLVYAERFGREAYVVRAHRLSAHDRPSARANERFLAVARNRDRRAAQGASRRECATCRAFSARRSAHRPGRLCRLRASPNHALAAKHLKGRAPSVLTFGVHGGLEAAKAFYDALKLVKRLVNIGDMRSLCCQPALTTHRQMSPEQQRRVGGKVETIRLSVGIEHAEDIVEDLDQALRAAASIAPSLAAE